MMSIERIRSKRLAQTARRRARDEARVRKRQKSLDDVRAFLHKHPCRLFEAAQMARRRGIPPRRWRRLGIPRRR